jgi:S-disulfanyl-L-cysteine oxidoreductase SoxD
MPTPSSAVQGVWFALLLVAGATSAEAPNLGKPVGTADIAAWDISIQPNGTGLPPGAGIATDGARIYLEKCASAMARTAKAGLRA